VEQAAKKPVAADKAGKKKDLMITLAWGKKAERRRGSASTVLSCLSR